MAAHCDRPGLVLVGLYMGVYFAIWGWIAGLVAAAPIADETRIGGRPASSVRRAEFHLGTAAA